MAEYEAFDPHSEVLGVAVMSHLAGIGEEAVSTLQKYGLYPTQADQWYNIQDVLNALRDLKEGNYMNLVSVGMQIPDKAQWPPDVKTVHAALTSIDMAYKMNHRGGEIGSYTYKKTGERSGTMICHNPYPSDLDYGLIYRVAQKFRPDTDGDLMVKRDDSKPNRKNGGDSCTYHVTW